MSIPSDNPVPLSEYPRPQFVRENWNNLNGTWKYAITDSETAPDIYDGEILVPYSPECELSGVRRHPKATEYLWYNRQFICPPVQGKRVLLHFGAADFDTNVFINGYSAGKHSGGYTPFTFDITNLISQNSNDITVRIKDYSDTSYHSCGKQAENRGGIWYTSQSGIWQTVWTEYVPEKYISSLVITPLFDEGKVQITAVSDTDTDCEITLGERTYRTSTNIKTNVEPGKIIPWTPETPALYYFCVKAGDDEVKSYFAMRKFSTSKDENGVPRLMLNNKPYFHNGLLDQGYYSTGLYTPPSDEAMIKDISSAKDMGFNMLRKHIKIEPLRWYYHCDRLGMIVWQDMVNGGTKYNPVIISAPLVTGIHLKDDRYNAFGRGDKEGREEYYKETEETVKTLYNAPCIAMWVLFNEGWGQFDSKEAYRRLLLLDTTRTVDHASGWHDQGISDVKSLHVYFKKYRFKPDRAGRSVVLSEFGGYNKRVKDHAFNDKDFGYKRFTSSEELYKALEDLYTEQIIPAHRKGLSAAVYTQLTDVEDELNGLITYDRAVQKIPSDKMKALFSKLFD